jgi:hypothetical protein
MTTEVRMKTSKAETCGCGLRISASYQAVSKPHCPFGLLALTVPAFEFRGENVRLVQGQQEEERG